VGPGLGVLLGTLQGDSRGRTRQVPGRERIRDTVPVKESGRWEPTTSSKPNPKSPHRYLCYTMFLPAFAFLAAGFDSQRGGTPLTPCRFQGPNHQGLVPKGSGRPGPVECC
jgi:hypothetical protein